MKNYKLPLKSKMLFMDMKGVERLRDIYARLPFMHKRAVKCAKLASRLKSKAWDSIYEIYPELRGKDATADFDNDVLTFENKKL
jgi:hypothetical protein